MDPRKWLILLALVGTAVSISFTKDDDPDAFKDPDLDTTKAPVITTTTQVITSTTELPTTTTQVITSTTELPTTTTQVITSTTKLPTTTARIFRPRGSRRSRRPRRTTTHAPWHPSSTTRSWYNPTSTTRSWYNPTSTRSWYNPTSTRSWYNPIGSTPAPWHPRIYTVTSQPWIFSGGYTKGSEVDDDCPCRRRKNHYPWWNRPYSQSSEHKQPLIFSPPRAEHPHHPHFVFGSPDCGKLGWHKHEGSDKLHFHRPSGVSNIDFASYGSYSGSHSSHSSSHTKPKHAAPKRASPKHTAPKHAAPKRKAHTKSAPKAHPRKPNVNRSRHVSRTRRQHNKAKHFGSLNKLH